MDENRIDEILRVVEEKSVTLDEDPITRGPKWLNGKVAKCRNLTTKIQEYEREVGRAIMLYERKLNKLEAEYEMKMNDKLANDNSVKQLTSARDRQAKAEDMLRDLKQKILEVELDLTDMKHVRSVVKSKVRELREVTSNIRLQRDLIKQEIKLGADQGDHFGTDDPDLHIDSGDIDVEEDSEPEPLEEEEEDVDLTELLGEDDPDVDPDEFEEVFGGSSDSSEEDYDSMLDSISTEAPSEFEDFVPSSEAGSASKFVVAEADEEFDVNAFFDE